MAQCRFQTHHTGMGKIVLASSHERGRWFQKDLWLNKSVHNGSVQNVSIRLMRFHVKTKGSRVHS